MENQYTVKSIIWKGDSLHLLDQRALPKQEKYVVVQNLSDTVIAIKSMVVRGAPAIAITGLFGLVLFAKTFSRKPTWEEWLQALEELLNSRPTAVNLKLAVENVSNSLKPMHSEFSQESLISYLEEQALEYYSSDLQTNALILKNGVALLRELLKKDSISIITHCNTGALATAGIGTALGIIRGLHRSGLKVTVYADETRPYHQGSRLTAWEMQQEGIDCYIIADSMAAWLMKEREIDAVIVGADRIASNGDTANKIGTYNLSVVAREHSVPFYIAASESSFDFTITNGAEIVIEMREPAELTQNSFLKDKKGQCILAEGVLAPVGAKALNPSFDVTPSDNITAIVTEKGVIQPVSTEIIATTIQE
ncbi:MAG: S-methyl-5-thioribose-1-phosphate isomerase [Spirochaetota bacterium]